MKSLIFALCLTWFSAAAWAAEPMAPKPDIGYYTFKEDFVTNVETLNPRDKLHFIRVKISLMLGDENDEPIIVELEPLLKDSIINILGAKEFSTIASTEGRETIRGECHDKISEIMQDKVGRQVVSDVLFLSYIYQ